MQSRLQSNKEQKCLKNRSVPAHGAGGSALLQLHITWTSRLHGHFYHKKKENSGATAKEQSGIQICSERAEQKVQNSAEWIRMVQMCSALSGCFRNMKS